jgi:hypothetical protein
MLLLGSSSPVSSGGGAPAGCTAATNYLARTTGGNEGGNATNITTLICGLVTDGVITGDLSGATGCGAFFDGLYITAQQNATDAKLNLCGTSYGLGTTTATFTSYQGYSAFPSPPIDTGFNPSTASGHFNPGSGGGFVGSMSVWAYDAPNNIQVGTSSSGTSFTYLLANLSSVFYCDINNSAADNSVASPTTNGFYSCDRTGQTNTNLYFNGSSLGTGNAAASNAVDNIDLFIGGRQTDLSTTKTLSEASFGGPLGATLQTALYTRLRAYMTAVGVP